MLISYYEDEFKLELPVARDGVFWNGRPDEFNNIGYGLEYSQEFGYTPYSKTGVYGMFNGKPRNHNGHDVAGVLGTPLVAPLDCWVTYTGFDNGGYGNFVFFETKSKVINGKSIKMEFVLAHMKEIIAKPFNWYKKGDLLGTMGSTGMSTGPHTHLGGRPYLVNDKLNGDDEYRGYVDLTNFFITKPIYNKQLLLNERMKLIKLKVSPNIYAISPSGHACMILNFDSYQKGLTLKMWEDKVDTVGILPPLGEIITLSTDN